MRKHEILYSWLQREIEKISNSGSMEDFGESLSEERQDLYMRLTEELRNTLPELTQASANRGHYLKWRHVYELVDQYSREFSDFPELDAVRLKVSIVIAMALAAAGCELNGDDVDVTVFELRQITNRVADSSFYRINAADFSQSLVLLDVDRLDELLGEVPLNSAPEPLLLHLKHAVENAPFPLSGQCALVKRLQPVVSEDRANAFVRVSMVSAGRRLHPVAPYSRATSILNPDTVQIENAYEQMTEVVDILSEYVGSGELLTKYLALYHVLENFMVRKPIVALERNLNGRMISIRDFRRLYTQVDKREGEALRELIRDAFGTVTAANYSGTVRQRWWDYFDKHGDILIGPTLAKLTLTKSNGDLVDREFVTEGNAADVLSRMVYAVRNAIVHNKETEFHLSAMTITPVITDLLDTLLLPVMEEICFELVGSQNPIVWYDNKTLNLYGN